VGPDRSQITRNGIPTSVVGKTQLSSRRWMGCRPVSEALEKLTETALQASPVSASTKAHAVLAG
jgi:hypothetical protein